MKIIMESKGGVYGAHLEFTFDEILKHKEFEFNDNLTSKSSTDGLDTCRSVDSLENSIEDKPAPPIKAQGSARRFSQVILDVSELRQGTQENEAMKELKEICQQALEVVRTHNSFHFLVAVDGSAESDAVFQVAMSLRKKFDRLTFFHPYSDSEQHDERIVPRLYRQKALFMKYDTMLTTSCCLKSNQYAFNWIKRSETDTNRDALIKHLQECQSKYDSKAEEAILNLAGIKEALSTETDSEKKLIIDNANTVLKLLESLQHPPDFIVLSSPGRRNMSTQHQLFHKVNLMALYEITTSTILVRKPPKKSAAPAADTTHIPESGPSAAPISKKYVMAVNKSETSKQGLQMLFTLIHPHDSLELVYVFKEFQESQSCKVFDTFGQDKLREIQTYYEKQLAYFGPSNSVFTVINTSSFKLGAGLSARGSSTGHSTISGHGHGHANHSHGKRSSLSGIIEVVEGSLVSPRSAPTSPRVLPPLMNFGNLTDRSQISHDGSRIISARSDKGSTSARSDIRASGSTSARKLSARELVANAMESPRESMQKVCYDDKNDVLKYDNEAKQLYYNQISSIVVDYVNVKLAEHPPDFFAIAPSVENKSTLTESFLAQIECNFIIVKV